MNDRQEAEGPTRRDGARDGRRDGWRGGALRPLAVVALALALGACTAVTEMTQGEEAAAARRPQTVNTEGAADEFPNLSAVPSEVPPTTAPEDRRRIMAELMEDRAQATYTQPEPLEASAPSDPSSQPLSRSVIISGDGTTTTASRSDLGETPLTTSAGGGQLAAIVFFGHGSSELDAQDRSVLRDIVALHRQRGGRLRVVGHASSRTQNATPEQHEVANLDMSMIRAEAVQAELLALGVAAEAVETEALGDAEPVYHEFMPSGETGNRRVEIFLEN